MTETILSFESRFARQRARFFAGTSRWDLRAEALVLLRDCDREERVEDADRILGILRILGVAEPDLLDRFAHRALYAGSAGSSDDLLLLRLAERDSLGEVALTDRERRLLADHPIGEPSGPR